jgi:hypothetical protein
MTWIINGNKNAAEHLNIPRLIIDILMSLKGPMQELKSGL